MKYIDRNRKITEVDTSQDKVLKWIYSSPFGRALIKPFTAPAFSRFMGAVLDSRLSTALIVPFVKKNKIDMEEYKPKFYSSYNEFFSP